MRAIQTILVTTDFSETSKRAFPLARELAERFRARLVLVHVHEEWTLLMGEYGQPLVQEVFEEQRRMMEGRLHALARELGSDVQVATALGAPHQEIVRLARERPADLIVMATHGRGFVSHALLGSTTERVLRRAPCPVVVVRDAGEEPS